MERELPGGADGGRADAEGMKDTKSGQVRPRRSTPVDRVRGDSEWNGGDRKGAPRVRSDHQGQERMEKLGRLG
jgi:hypothetical protein